MTTMAEMQTCSVVAKDAIDGAHPQSGGKTAQAIETAQAAGAILSAHSLPSLKSLQSIQSIQSLQSLQSANSAQAMQTIGDIEPVKTDTTFHVETQTDPLSVTNEHGDIVCFFAKQMIPKIELSSSMGSDDSGDEENKENKQHKTTKIKGRTLMENAPSSSLNESKPNATDSNEQNGLSSTLFETKDEFYYFFSPLYFGESPVACLVLSHGDSRPDAPDASSDANANSTPSVKTKFTIYTFKRKYDGQHVSDQLGYFQERMYEHGRFVPNKSRGKYELYREPQCPNETPSKHPQLIGESIPFTSASVGNHGPAHTAHPPIPRGPLGAYPLVPLGSLGLGAKVATHSMSGVNNVNNNNRRPIFPSIQRWVQSTIFSGISCLSEKRDDDEKENWKRKQEEHQRQREQDPKPFQQQLQQQQQHQPRMLHPVDGIQFYEAETRDIPGKNPAIVIERQDGSNSMIRIQKGCDLIEAICLWCAYAISNGFVID